MSKSNCEPALLSSLETLQHNLQDAGMLRMKASLYSEAAVREALGDSEYRRISEKHWATRHASTSPRSSNASCATFSDCWRRNE